MITSTPVFAPGAANPVNVGATSTTAQDTGGALKIWVQVSADMHIRFGGANVDAATTDDIKLSASSVEGYYLDLTPGLRYFRAIRASADGVLRWARIA